ncbi:MAG: hypothetical protein ACRED2_09135 [Methylocella sp.]
MSAFAKRQEELRLRRAKADDRLRSHDPATGLDNRVLVVALLGTRLTLDMKGAELKGCETRRSRPILQGW